jgi:hypothetical protein
VKASVSGITEEDVIYSWSVSGGRIASGLGTSSIQIVPGPELQNITVTVEIETGACRLSASTTVGVSNLPPSDFGKLEGIVRDPRNRPLNGATVTVFLSNNATAEEITRNGGKYKFDQLIIGDHDVEASHNRYGSDRKTVNVKKDRTTNQDFKLKSR